MAEFKIEMGAMVEAPIFETHRRGRNWMATINENPRAPWGIERKFIPRGKGRFLYIVGESLVGSPIEFGADYFSGSGNRTPKRWFGVVREVTPDKIVIEEFSSPQEAINAATALRTTMNNKHDLKENLLKEKERLLDRIREIDEELMKLNNE